MAAYFNGNFLEKNQIRIDPDDRGFLFADGIYEVIRTYNGRLFRAEEHARRMQHGARALRFDETKIPDMIAIAEELLDRNDLRSGGHALIYCQITRGAAPRSHAFPPSETPFTVYATARRLTSRKEEQVRGIETITVPDQRWSRCDIKSIALLPNTLAHQQARDAGAVEAIFVRNGTVQEGSHSNVLIVKNGIVETPPLTNCVLAGITRQFVLELCRDTGIPYRETPVFLKDFYTADEAMVTGTSLEITPVVRSDGKTIGNGEPGPITRQLQKAFQERTG